MLLKIRFHLSRSEIGSEILHFYLSLSLSLLIYLFSLERERESTTKRDRGRGRKTLKKTLLNPESDNVGLARSQDPEK